MLALAVDAARAGAAVLREAGLASGRAGTAKRAADYVTSHDLASESAIVEVLRRGSPGVAILAEEAGGDRRRTMWAVDPLDGTTNFMRGMPVFAVSVALLDAGRPVVGAVIAPWLDLEFTVERGRGARLNGELLAGLAPCPRERAIVATGMPFRRKERLPRYLPVLKGAFERFEDIRRAGAAALDLAWIASGTFDGYFELGLSTWDLAAGAALIEEVGGTVSDWSGGDGWLESGDIIAGSPAVHGALLELTAKAPPG